MRLDDDPRVPLLFGPSPIHLAARTEGMLSDPVYEGKSLAGLIGMIGSGHIAPGSRVRYAQLGGQLALSAYANVPGLV